MQTDFAIPRYMRYKTIKVKINIIKTAIMTSISAHTNSLGRKRKTSDYF